MTATVLTKTAIARPALVHGTHIDASLTSPIHPAGWKSLSIVQNEKDVTKLFVAAKQQESSPIPMMAHINVSLPLRTETAHRLAHMMNRADSGALTAHLPVAVREEAPHELARRVRCVPGGHHQGIRAL